MNIQIHYKTLKNNYFTYNMMAFIPSSISEETDVAVFTHGYTSCKKDVLPWAQRLSEGGIPTVIFDLPGHYLGSYNEVDNFNDFEKQAPYCFYEAFLFLKNFIPNNKINNIVLGGHSLGALLSIKAMELSEFQNFKKVNVSVGYGLGTQDKNHLFETTFYEKTLKIRRQLVSKALDSDIVFKWIKEQKLLMTLKDETIFIITGKDDVVVGTGGAHALAFELEHNGCEVNLIEPNKLPHHEPGLAQGHIFHALKRHLKW